MYTLLNGQQWYDSIKFVTLLKTGQHVLLKSHSLPSPQTT